MDCWKEFQLLKAGGGDLSLGEEWPKFDTIKDTLDRNDLVAYLMAFAEGGSIRSVDMTSITSEEEAKILAAGGLTVSWQTAKQQKKAKKEEAAAPKDEEEPVADEEKKEEEASEEKPTEDSPEEKNEEAPAATEEGETTEGPTGKCVANTSITGDRRTHAVAAGLRALLTLDNLTSGKDEPSITISGTATDDELSPAFSPQSGNIRVSGTLFKTPDHFLANQKAELFGTQAEKDAIAAASSGGDARKLAKELKGFNEDKWNETRPEVVFAAVIAALYANRRSYYTVITKSKNSLFSCEDRPAWAKALNDARLYLLYKDFGAHLAGHPDIAFTNGGRITLLGGIKGHGVRLTTLCEDCLARPRAIGCWQRLLYALRHGRNLSGLVNRSGVILLISDLLYKESTDTDVIRLCINICAALAADLGYVDKEVVGFLIKYYLDQRDTWAVLGELDHLYYNDEISKRAFSIFFNKEGGRKGGADPKDIYHRTHAVKVISKLLTSPKSAPLAQRIAEDPANIDLLIDTLKNSALHSSLGGWNDLMHSLSSACTKTLLLVGKHIATTTTKKEEEVTFAPKMIQFLSSAYNEEVQSHSAVLLEKTQAALSDEQVAEIVALVKQEFIEMRLSAPDRAEDLADLLSALSTRNPEAGEILFTLGQEHFAQWAIPTVSAICNAIASKNGAFKAVEGFFAKSAKILRQALDNSDETAIGDLVTGADAISGAGEEGIKALQEEGLLSPLLQWATEVEEDSLQEKILTIAERLTTGVLVSEEDAHIIELMLEVLVEVQRSKAQSFILQGFLNLVAAGTTKAAFDTCIHLSHLSKTMIGKENQKTTVKLLTDLGVKVEAKKTETAAKGSGKKEEGGSGAGKTDNPFQMLVATKAQKKEAATGGSSQSSASAAGGSTHKKSGGGPEAKAPKGFTQIAAKKHKDKDTKKKAVAAGAASQYGGSNRVSNKNKFSRDNTTTTTTRGGDRDGGERERGAAPHDIPAPRGARGGDNTRKYDRDYDDEGSHFKGGSKYQRDQRDETSRGGGRGRGGTTTTTSAPPPALGGKGQFRDPQPISRGGTAVNYQKEREAKASSSSYEGPRVIKTQARGGRGVNLSQLNQQITQASSANQGSKKPTSWAGIAKFANEKETREEKARQDAEEQQRLVAEERSRIAKMQKAATTAPQPIDPVSEMFKKLLPGGASVRSVVSTDRDVAEVEADKRRMEVRNAEKERKAREEEERRENERLRQQQYEREQQRLREAEAQRERDERERAEQAERERQETVRKAREEAERAAAAVGAGSNSTWNTSSSTANNDPLSAIKQGWNAGGAGGGAGAPGQSSGAPNWGVNVLQPAPLGGIPQQQGGSNNNNNRAPGGLPMNQQQQPFGNFTQQQQFNNNQQQQGRLNNQQFTAVGGRQGQNNNHPWQQHQQTAQAQQAHWAQQHQQFQQQRGGSAPLQGIPPPGQQQQRGGNNTFLPPQQGGGVFGTGIPQQQQPQQGIPQQQQNNQQQFSNPYQPQTSNNQVRLNANAGLFDGSRLQ